MPLVPIKQCIVVLFDWCCKSPKPQPYLLMLSEDTSTTATKYGNVRSPTSKYRVYMQTAIHGNIEKDWS